MVIAIGNNPNPLIPRSMPDLANSKWGTIIVDENTMATSVPGVCRGRYRVRRSNCDQRDGPSPYAAVNIQKYLNGEDIPWLRSHRNPERATYVLCTQPPVVSYFFECVPHRRANNLPDVITVSFSPFPRLETYTGGRCLPSGILSKSVCL